MRLQAHVDREEALAYLGHRGQSLGADLSERLERAAALCESELTPRGVCQGLPLDDALALLPGRDIASHLAGCAETVLMAVTLGADGEMLLRRESAVSPTDGLLADACASSLVEQAANGLNRRIVEEAAARGMVATERFSPGYGDLPLSCQPAFLRACGADRALGLRATAANLLVPAKSITAVIGLRPVSSTTSTASAAAGTADSPAAAPVVGALDPRCASCPLAPTCALRAQGRTCHGSHA